MIQGVFNNTDENLITVVRTSLEDDEFFKREKASARASSDRFCPCPCLSLSLISSYIPI